MKEDIVSRIKTDMFEYGKASFDRSIPSSADGFKQIHRRILYVCFENKFYNSPVRLLKLGGLVAAYHGHGDSSIFGAIINMARDGVTQNHALLKPVGTFGSFSSLNASNPKYISTLVSPFGKDVVMDAMNMNSMSMIESEVDFNTKEPEFIPTKVPMILINGSSGIAVSFATDIPPHNLREVVDISVKYIKNKNITAKQLARGLYPDYPSGGVIVNPSLFTDQYYSEDDTSGTIIVRGDVELDNVKSMIYVRSLPINQDFETFIDKAKKAKYAKDAKGNPKNLTLHSGIISIGEAEEYKNGPAYVYIECKKNANLYEILEDLYLYTNLEVSNKMNMNLYHEGNKIKKSTIKSMIHDWYVNNYEVRTKQIVGDISRFQNNLHILEGLYTVYDKIDDIISIIRKSNGDKHEIISKLTGKGFNLTLVQARGIYSMQLGKLSRRSKRELESDINNLKSKIIKLTNDLNNIDNLIIEDLLYIKNKYGRDRKTKIIESDSTINSTVSSGGILASHSSVGIFDLNNIVSGKKITNGLKNVKIGNTWVKEIVSSHDIVSEIDSIAVFFDNSTVQSFAPQEINSWINVGNEQAFITTISPIYKGSNGYILTIDESGNIKLLKIDDITNRPSKTALTVIDSAYISVDDIDKVNVLIVNSNGDFVNFPVKDEIPILNRNGKGVKSGLSGKSLRVSVIDKDSDLLLLTEHSKLHNGEAMTIHRDNIIDVNRNRKPKKILPYEYYNVKGVRDIDLSDRKQIIIFVSKDTVFSLKIDNVRNLKAPRKLFSVAMNAFVIHI